MKEKKIQNTVLQAYCNTEFCKSQGFFVVDVKEGKIMDTYNIIKELCDEKGIKLSALAQAVGIGSSVFTELKKGRTKNLSVATLEKISDYFQVPMSLLTGEDSGVDCMRNELFRKRKLLFDLSAKATEEDLDKLIKIVDALTN